MECRTATERFYGPVRNGLRFCSTSTRPIPRPQLEVQGTCLAVRARSAGGIGVKPVFAKTLASSLAQALALSWFIALAPALAAAPAVTDTNRESAPDPVRDDPRLGSDYGARSGDPRSPTFRLFPVSPYPGEGSPNLSLALDTLASGDGGPEWLEKGDQGFLAPDVGAAYLEWTLPHRTPLLDGATIRVGKFWSLLGAGMIDPSGSTSVFQLGVPLSQGGILATQPVGNRFSLTAGLVRSWDRVSGTPAIVGVSNASWLVNSIVTLEGNFMWDPEPTSGLQVADVVAIVYPLPSVTCLIDLNRGHVSGGDPSQPAMAWQSATAVASYAFSPRGVASVRSEWLERAHLGGAATEGASWVLAASATYDLTSRLLGRLEYRQERLAQALAPSRDGSDGVVWISLVSYFD